jgi:hypothetical protein
MNCPYCSEQHPDNARFCPVTGQTIPEQLTCAGCGRETKAGVTFCPYCGSTTFLDKSKAHLKVGRKRRATILWILIGVVALFFVVLLACSFLMDYLSITAIDKQSPLSVRDANSGIRKVYQSCRYW